MVETADMIKLLQVQPNLKKIPENINCMCWPSESSEKQGIIQMLCTASRNIPVSWYVSEGQHWEDTKLAAQSGAFSMFSMGTGSTETPLVCLWISLWQLVPVCKWQNTMTAFSITKSFLCWKCTKSWSYWKNSEHLSQSHLVIDSRLVWFKSRTWLEKLLEIMVLEVLFSKQREAWGHWGLMAVREERASLWTAR